MIGTITFGYLLTSQYQFISVMDFDKLESQLKSQMEKDDKYWRENDAKFRAAKQMATYEEFVEIVKVLHNVVCQILGLQ